MFLKRSFSILFLSFLLVSCQSPKQLIQSGNYDKAFRVVAKKAANGSTREKTIAYLKQSFEAANESDLSRIRYLKMSGEPSAWVEIFERYQYFDSRQAIARNFPSSVKEAIHFQPVDVVADLILAKNKAQEYLYAKAKQLLATKDRADAAQALSLLTQLRQISPDHPDINMLLKDAEFQATKRVLIEFVNQSGAPLPSEIVERIMQISTARLDEKFLSFDIKQNRNITYDSKVEVLLTGIAVSPERIDRRQFAEKKSIADGTQPKRDARGNILYDSAGKVIEETRYREVEAQVKEVTMTKEAVLSIKLRFLELPAKRLLDQSSTDLVQEFFYRYAVVNNDLRACSPETLRLSKLEPIPFPPDYQMIFDASEKLNQWVVGELQRKKSMLRQNPG